MTQDWLRFSRTLYDGISHYILFVVVVCLGPILSIIILTPCFLCVQVVHSFVLLSVAMKGMHLFLHPMMKSWIVFALGLLQITLLYIFV